MVTQSLALELTWTLIPLALVTGIFFWGLNQYIGARWRRATPWKSSHGQEVAVGVRIPERHPHRQRGHIPVGKPVKFVMSSETSSIAFSFPACA